MTVSATRRLVHSKLAPAVLIIAGGLLAGLAFWSADASVDFPYRRSEQTVSQEEVSKTLGLPIDPSFSVKRVSYFLPDRAAPIASALALSTEAGNTALTWENHIAEPVLSGDASLDETSRVLNAIRAHVGDDGIVLAWWDFSRKVRLIAKKQAPLDDAEGRGLLIPAAWESQKDAVRRAEAQFWKGQVSESAARDFSAFAGALLKPETEGANELERLAGDRKAFVVLRLSDIWRLASEQPEAFSVASKDFPGSAQSHGVIRQVRDWMREAKQEYPYAVEPIGTAVRIHYLPKPDQQNLLIAKLLPFTTTNPLGLNRFRLVFQHRGYWIYRLVPAAEASAS